MLQFLALKYRVEYLKMLILSLRNCVSHVSRQHLELYNYTVYSSSVSLVLCVRMVLALLKGNWIFWSECSNANWSSVLCGTRTATKMSICDIRVECSSVGKLEGNWVEPWLLIGTLRTSFPTVVHRRRLYTRSNASVERFHHCFENANMSIYTENCKPEKKKRKKKRCLNKVERFLISAHTPVFMCVVRSRRKAREPHKINRQDRWWP